MPATRSKFTPLVISPESELLFTGPFSHRSHAVLSLINPSADKRIAFKIKSTAGKTFLRAEPCRGVVEIGQTVTIELTVMPVTKKSSCGPPACRIQVQSTVIDEQTSDLDTLWKFTMWKKLQVDTLACVYAMPGGGDDWGEAAGGSNKADAADDAWGEKPAVAAAAAETEDWDNPSEEVEDKGKESQDWGIEDRKDDQGWGGDQVPQENNGGGGDQGQPDDNGWGGDHGQQQENNNCWDDSKPSYPVNQWEARSSPFVVEPAQIYLSRKKLLHAASLVFLFGIVLGKCFI